MNSKRSSPSDGLDSRSRVAAQYIGENFDPEDRLAIVLMDKRTQDVVQRIASATKIAADDFQAWLRYKNANGYEVYVSMNALGRNANGRTKADVETIRHIYLDFDEGGTIATEKLLDRVDLPKPNYLLNTSPDKWQAIWKVHGFAKDQAENLQRGLVRETGADPAATDCSRVLRLPGFYNHKYSDPFWIASQALSQEIYGPERFPEFPAEDRASKAIVESGAHAPRKQTTLTGWSQSERDWAFAKRALARGDPEEMVVMAIASYRRFDKHNPRYYAEITVRKAVSELKEDAAREPRAVAEPER
jgi:hypothetical protein